MKTTEEKAKHTPGPWEADIHMGNNGYPIADMIEPSICEMVSVHSPEETKANARLIAAAPEMLSILERVLAFEQRLKASPMDAGYVLVSDIRAAISKAGGGL